MTVIDLESGQRQAGTGSAPSGRIIDLDSGQFSNAIAHQQTFDFEAERQRILEDMNADIGPLEAGLIAAGRGLTKIGRALGIANPEDPITSQAFNDLKDQQGAATLVGEIFGEAAPFLIPGLGVSAIAGTGVRVAATGALGAAEGLLISKGEGRSGEEQAMSAGIGGAVASAFELVLPRLGRIGRRVIRRVRGKEPSVPVVDKMGNISDEFRDALKAENRTLDDVLQVIDDEVAEDFADPEQVARKAFLESQGLKPTRAQITREAADFQAQQEAAKSTSRVRTALEEQEAALTTRFQQAVTGTGGEAGQATSTITDALVDKATVLDQKIGTLYKQARERSPGVKNVRLGKLANKLRELAPANRRTNGNIEAVVGDLQSKGVLDKNMKVVGKIDVETAEDVRKLMNELYDPSNSFGNTVLRDLKQSLDDDVFKAAGDDVFRDARAAKHAFESELARAKISKFDSRKANLVRDVLENKIDPDRFAEQVVFSKKWRSADLQQLKDYVSTNPAGKQAFDDLRADVMDEIKNRAFIGPVDKNGFQALSRDKLQRAINNVGKDKLAVLFSPDERRFLDNMLEVGKLREPVRGTALGRGPSAQAIGRLALTLNKLPLLGDIIEAISVDQKGRLAVKTAVKRLPKSGSPISQAAGVGAVAATNQENE